MKITISEVSQEFASNGSEYRKVKGTTDDGKEVTKQVFNNLEDKWDLLVEGNQVEFKMVKKGQFWNVADILPVEQPPEPEPTVSPSAETPKVDEKPPGQQVGMTTKEIGDMIRAGKMKSIFGIEAGIELTKWYRSQILGTTRVSFDGAKLPKFSDAD